MKGEKRRNQDVFAVNKHHTLTKTLNLQQTSAFFNVHIKIHSSVSFAECHLGLEAHVVVMQ